MEMKDEEMSVEEQRNENLQVWKKNKPLLYDMLFYYELPTSSLTVEWGDCFQSPTDPSQTFHKLVIGTMQAENLENYNEPDYLQVMQFTYNRPPKVKVVENELVPEMKTLEYDNPKQAASLNYRQSAESLLKPQVKMIHPQEVNRARFMPQNKLVIATRTQKSEEGYSDVLIYKYNKHKTYDPKENILDKRIPEAKPNYILRHHTDEGFGICWNPNRKGDLLTCGRDRTICLWTLRDGSPEASVGVIKPERIISGVHSDSVEDVAWNFEHQNLFCSVGNDSNLFLWDTRNTSGYMYALRGTHEGRGINCISWNQVNCNIIATGGVDHNINIYDVRKFSTPLDIIKTGGEVQVLQWNPHYEDVLVSGCQTGKINIYDVSKAWDEQTPEEKEEGPPELVFIHEGHGSEQVCDLAWNPDEEFLISSVAQDSTLQIWKPASHYCKKARVNVDSV